MKNSQRGYVWPVVLAIIALFAIGSGIYYFAKIKTTNVGIDNPAISESTSTAQVAGWKTYTNAQYGFSIQYPAQWKTTDADFPTLVLIYDASQVKPDSDQQEDSVSFDIDTICKGHDWADGFGVRLYKAVCLKTPAGISFVMAANSKGAQTLEDQIFSTFKIIKTNQVPVVTKQLPTSCIDQQESDPVITSLSSYSGPVGTKLEIRGCNFAGFESDLNVLIENSQGIKGILYSELGSTAKLMDIVLKSQACQTDESYRGLPCASYLNLIPGIYKIYTSPWGKKSNEAVFTIN